MTSAGTTTGLPTPPDPPQDRAEDPLPPQIADVLALLHILLTYARHLTATLEHRAAARGFSCIAQFFGTARLPVIRARLARGLLRIAALERVLRARAARGRDLVFLPPRRRSAHAAKPPGAPQAAAPDSPPPRRAPRRAAERDGAPDPDALPTLAQLEADIRRRPIGQAIADICRDLAISPSLCEGRMWNAVFDAIVCYRGNLPRLIRDFRAREVAFEPEMDADPNLTLPEQTRDGLRRMLGFFIGQDPVTPFWVPAPQAPAASTGPP